MIDSINFIHEDFVKHYWYPRRLIKYGLKEFDE